MKRVAKDSSKLLILIVIVNTTIYIATSVASYLYDALQDC